MCSLEVNLHHVHPWKICYCLSACCFSHSVPTEITFSILCTYYDSVRTPREPSELLRFNWHYCTIVSITNITQLLLNHVVTESKYNECSAMYCYCIAHLHVPNAAILQPSWVETIINISHLLPSMTWMHDAAEGWVIFKHFVTECNLNRSKSVDKSVEADV